MEQKNIRNSRGSWFVSSLKWNRTEAATDDRERGRQREKERDRRKEREWVREKEAGRVKNKNKNEALKQQCKHSPAIPMVHLCYSFSMLLVDYVQTCSSMFSSDDIKYNSIHSHLECLLQPGTPAHQAFLLQSGNPAHLAFLLQSGTHTHLKCLLQPGTPAKAFSLRAQVPLNEENLGAQKKFGSTMKLLKITQFYYLHSNHVHSNTHALKHRTSLSHIFLSSRETEFIQQSTAGLGS